MNFAIIIPMANEESDFHSFHESLVFNLDKIKSGSVYFIIDNVSKDRTLDLCNEVSERDHRFKTIWAPENKNVVDAYIRGYKEALNENYEIIIEMDAGLSHDPNALNMFLRVLSEGNECAFGSRFINGGSIHESNIQRHFLSKFGTFLSNLLLGTKLKDMTSGYQGFHRKIVNEFISYPFRSKAHFYQTELRYLLRYKKIIEVPIHYRAPSPRVSKKSIFNSIQVLLYYFKLRILRKSSKI